MTTNKSKFSILLNNNKFVFVIAFLSSIIIWLAVAINVSPETTRTINKFNLNYPSKRANAMQVRCVKVK